MKHKLINWVIGTAVMWLMFVLLAVVWCTQVRAFDKTPGALDVTAFNNQFSYVHVVTTGTALALVPVWDTKTDAWVWEPREAEFAVSGSGFVVSPGYVVTAAHIIIPKRVSVVYGRCSSYNTEVWKVLTRIVKIYDYKSESTIATVHFVNTDYDMAILSFPVNDTGEGQSGLRPMEIQPWPVPRSFEVGDAVAVIVHKRGDDGTILSDLTVVYGKITDESLPLSLGPRLIAYFNTLDFTTDAQIQPGDSGSPVFVFHQGRPYLIGVAHAISIANMNEPGSAENPVWQSHVVEFIPFLRYIQVKR